ncbi:hypothetical protein LCGC14_2096440, partial [marine sediment metagenome]
MDKTADKVCPYIGEEEMKQADIKELWELCGLMQNDFGNWGVPDKNGILTIITGYNELPELTLDNLFRYAVSRRIDDKDDGYQIEITGVTLCPNEGDWWCELTYNWAEGGIFDHAEIDFTADEAADALGEACLKVVL